ncbi:hypothetical protein LLG96_04570 [bacterium]|nr:hypothetical protein [bacterium]
MRKGLFYGVIVTAAILLYAGCTSSKIESPVPEITSDVKTSAQLRTLFAEPPAQYRTVPFWVWNDDITEQEIDEQLADFKAENVGGLFIHPRPGLITPYLSDRWFTLCRYAVDKAKTLGIEVWLYDENSYPSGFAGGNVPAQMPESYEKGQGLVLRRATELPGKAAQKPYLVLKKEDSGFVDITGRLDQERNRKGDYYVFDLAYYGKSPWYGGYSYVDLLLDGVTEKFIEVTMSGYEKSIGSEFGKTVPGIFTDEPNIAPPAANCLRWTPSLFDKFSERWGYDLKATLPSLFEETGDWKRVRHDYYGLLLEQFIERWSKPWHDYCQKNNMFWTGHYWEHGWPSPHHGGDNMAMYAWHDVPSIDILMNEYSEDVNAQFGNARAVKELISAANQMGRTRTLSETYGAGGWDLRFEDMKRIGDWEYVLGVNTLNQHLSYVTIMGARKRDHPQSFSYHEPWWKLYREQVDYFGRLSLALSSGAQINHILVIEPTTTAWMYYGIGEKNEQCGVIGKSFQEFVQQLERYQVEYDIGCENIIKDHGSADNGKFIVGKRSYDLVVFPPGMENLDLPTARLIENYLKTGGKILSFVDAPKFVDGTASETIPSLASQYPGQWTRAGSVSEQNARTVLAEKDFTIIQPENISGKLFHHRRRFEDGELIFLVNTSLTESSTGALKTQGRAVLEFDPISGEITSYPAKSSGKDLTVAFNLPPAGSLLLFAGRSAEKGLKVKTACLKETPVPLSGELTVKMTAPNALTLDYCDLKLGGREQKDMYFFTAAQAIFKQFGLSGDPWHRAVQYKTNILDKNVFPPKSGFEARFPFSVDNGVDTASLQAVVERPNLWKVSINGKAVEPRPGEWRLDRSFGVYDIGEHVRPGMNNLTLTASPMTIHSELEPVYIYGNFGLKAVEKGSMIVSPLPLTVGSWKDQALPFYSDGVSYTGTYTLSAGKQRYLVRLGKWLGCVAEIQVNGKPAGIIGWPPYEADITGMVQDGTNEITVVVYGTLKNLLGPHHNNPPHGRAWPAMFESAPEHQPSGVEYDSIGYGLFENFSVIVCE